MLRNPCIAKEKGIGLEEAARNVRYAFFDKVLENEKDYSCIVTAHNATDNAETLIFNTFRGGGISAICGIPITRGNILRPLIAIKKKDILNSLTENNIEFVTDSTNKDTNVNVSVSEPSNINRTTSNVDPAIYTIANNCTDGKEIKFYDGGGSMQLKAEH